MQDWTLGPRDGAAQTVASIIGPAPLGGVQLRVLALCALIALLDGYDTLVIGLAAPALVTHLDISSSSFGGVFAVGLAGAAVGGLLFGPLGDRLGRRPALIACGLMFALFCGLTAWVTTLPQLLACRFLTGIGLGGAAPSFVALTAEFAPRRYRSAAVTAIWASLPLGGILGGALSAVAVPRFGWEILFYFGGLAPLLAVVLVWIWLPESPRFLMRSQKGRDRLHRILQKIDPREAANASVLESTGLGEAASRTSVGALFADGRRAGTLLLWGAFFFATIIAILVPLWTPTLLQEIGYSTERSSLMVSLFNVGAITGMILLGFLIDRFGALRIMIITFLFSAVTIGALGQVIAHQQLATVFFPIAGLAAGGGAAGIVALTSEMYPTELRSTGIGWAAAFGRVGQMSGPAASGALIGLGWGAGSIFTSFAAPPLFAAFFVIALTQVRVPERTHS